MERTMICEHSLPHQFQAEAVNITCHILNKCLIRPTLKKTLYELWNGKKLNIGYFHPFYCKFFVYTNGKDNLDKFDPRSDEGIFLGYSNISRSYRIFNKCTSVIEKSSHIIFDDSNHFREKRNSSDDEKYQNSQSVVIS